MPVRRPAAGPAAALVCAALLLAGPASSATVPVTGTAVTAIRSGAAVTAIRSDLGPSDALRPDLGLSGFGPVTVARGRRSRLVAAGTGAVLRFRADRLAGALDAAAAAVDRVWGTDWPREVTALLPADLDQMAALLGRPGPDPTAGLARLAAVTVGAGAVAPGPDATGRALRVVLNPDAFARLTPTGQAVVLTHEVTHVATRSRSTLAPPLWLQEGYADYLGYLDSGLGAAQVAVELDRALRSGAGPHGLPGDAAFDPGAGDPSTAYQESWTACLLLGRELGTGGLTAFYRSAAGFPAWPPTWPPTWPVLAVPPRLGPQSAGTGAVGRAGSAAGALERAFAATPEGDLRTFTRHWLGALPDLVRSNRPPPS